MAVLSGKRGTLYLDGNEITPVNNWKISISANLKPYAANDTRGCKKRVSGVFDATGTFKALISDTEGDTCCPVEKGGEYDALFYINAITDPVPSYYSIPIKIATIDVDDDIDDGEILAFDVTWEGNGPMEEFGILEYGPGGSSSSGA